MPGASLNLVAAVLRTISTELGENGVVAEVDQGSFNDLTSALGSIEASSKRPVDASTAHLARGASAGVDHPGPETADDAADALVAAMLPKVSGMELGEGRVSLSLTEGQEFFRVMTDAARAVLGEAPNYIEMQMQAPEGGRYIVWIGRPNGLTPHEARMRAESRYALLRSAAMGERHDVFSAEFGGRPATAAEFDAEVDALLARERR